MDKATIKQGLASCVEWCVPRAVRPLAVLMYHSIGGNVRGSVPARMFEKHLSILQGHIDCCSALQKGGAEDQCKPTGGVVITFDDGFRDNYEVAAPLLEDAGFRGIFFVTTGFVDGEIDITADFANYKGLEPMTWPQLNELEARGHVLGLHGHTHRDFGRLSQEQARKEVEVSAMLFRYNVGRVPEMFAYPFGQLEHQRSDLDDVFVSAGVRYVFTTENRTISRHDWSEANGRICRLPRIRVDVGDTATAIRQKISGAWNYVAYAQRIRSSWRKRSCRPLLGRPG